MKRNTSQREAIKAVFRKERRALGIDEVLIGGQRMVKTLNQATVYRNLKLLVEEGWLKKWHHPIKGTIYEPSDLAHHHHFHCRICEHIYEIEGCLLDPSAKAPQGFLTEAHDVFLYGVCPSCRKAETITEGVP
ncbi:MAG: transcriptional repressor [Thermodesulfobacteriota bacterium]